MRPFRGPWLPHTSAPVARLRRVGRDRAVDRPSRPAGQSVEILGHVIDANADGTESASFLVSTVRLRVYVSLDD